jgi:ADP-heptose:LPS heptosyltransferase
MREAERFSLLAASAGLTSKAGIHKISGSTIRSMHQVARATEWTYLADRIGIDRREAFAVISPGASNAVKRWPVERWLDVMTWLRQQDLQIVLLSGPDDADVARQLHAMDGMRAVLSDGTTTLAESVTLTSHAMVFLGNDSGPGHVAGSLGVPTLVIFSSTERCHPDMPGSPERNLPAGPNVTYCQPARSLWPCDQYCASRKAHCIKEVAVGQVLSQLRYLWESTFSKRNSGHADNGMPAEKMVF